MERATALAHRIVCEWGMSHRLGPITFGKSDGAVFLGRDLAKDRGYSEEIAFEIDKEIRRIVDESYARARDILEHHRDKLDLLAGALLDREVLDKEEVELLFDGKLSPLEEDPSAGDAGRASGKSQPAKEEKRSESDLPGLGSPAPSPA